MHHAHTRTFFFFFFQNFFLFLVTKTRDSHSVFAPNFWNFSHFAVIHSLILHPLIIKHLFSFIILLSKVSFLHFSIVFPIRKFEFSCLCLVDSVFTVSCLMMGSACMWMGVRRSGQFSDCSYIYSMHTRCLLKCLKGKLIVLE